MLTRDQRYATSAFQRVKARANDPDINRNRYSAMAQELPILLRTAGLLQTIDFLQRSNPDEDRMLLADMVFTVDEIQGDRSANQHEVDAFIDRCRSAGFHEYILIVELLLQISSWYKRAAQILLDTDSIKSNAATSTQAVEQVASTAPAAALPVAPAQTEP